MRQRFGLGWAFLAVASLLASLVGCGGDDATPAAVSVTQVIGAPGGTVELAGGGKVVIPPGALAQEVRIKITKLELDDVAALPPNLEAAGKPYAFQPHGTKFSLPVTIEVPFEGDAAQVRPIKLDDEKDTTWQTIVGSTKQNNKLAFASTTFSVILAARPIRNSGLITLPDGATFPADAAATPDASTLNDAAITMDASMLVDASSDAGLDAQILDGALDAQLDAMQDAGPTDAALADIGVAQLALGQNHSCALMVDGTVRCWGLGQFGRLGNNSQVNSVMPVQVSGLSGVTSITVGEQHGCALLADATVRCWGANTNGSLGDNTDMMRLSPVAVMALTGVVEIEAGRYHNCARLTDTTVRCWGYNAWGQLGDGTINDQWTPVAVPGLTNVVELALGNGYSCARLTDGTARCWGYNMEGDLGDGTLTERHVPTVVSGLSGVTEIVAGNNHSCALLSDTTVRCWGYNNLGQIGDGTGGNTRATPVAVSGLTGVTGLALGGNHTCALLSDATVMCWGYNVNGQLDDGTTMQRLLPVSSLNVSDAIAIAAGNGHNCALLSDQAIQCWGWNANGQLGF